MSVRRTLAGVRFERFCEAFLRHSKGEWAGQPVLLEPWQAEITDEVFRTVDGKRVHREALIGLPRKNGKSTLSAAIALYMLIADGEPGAEVYSAASSKDQARIVFDQAREMVLASPALLQHCEVQRNAIKVRGGGVYKVIAADAPRQHGLNPSCVVIDELHAHEDGGELYYALRTALGARRQPLVVSITTAGYDMDTICGEVYDRGRRGERGFYFKWLEVSDARLDDRTAWKEANPASWISVDTLEDDSHTLPRAVFERLHLNRWTGAEELWLPHGAWDGCKSSAKLKRGEEVYVGVDLGLKHDTAAVAWVAPRAPRKYVCRAQVWGLWPDTSKPEPPAHDVIREERLPLKLVKEYVQELARTYDVREIAYDPYRFEAIAQDLGDEGLWVVEFMQTDNRMVPASSGLYQAIMEQQLQHSGDPVLAEHVKNVAAVHTQSGWRIHKKKAKRPMDAAVALAMAVARAQANETPEAQADRKMFEPLA